MHKYIIFTKIFRFKQGVGILFVFRYIYRTPLTRVRDFTTFFHRIFQRFTELFVFFQQFCFWELQIKDFYRFFFLSYFSYFSFIKKKNNLIFPFCSFLFLSNF